MFHFHHRRRIAEITEGARAFVTRTFVAPAPPPPPPPPQHKPPVKPDTPGIKYSIATPPLAPEDSYDAQKVDAYISGMQKTGRYGELGSLLDKTKDLTFVEKVNRYIQSRGLRENALYKAAQMDRRLFSKVMSDAEYKPSRDTALAIAFALHLTADEAKDLLSRAGYTLSHSNKRDIVIEYFFRERVYDLQDINLVLTNLEMKCIGR